MNLYKPVSKPIYELASTNRTLTATFTIGQYDILDVVKRPNVDREPRIHVITTRMKAAAIVVIWIEVPIDCIRR
jgi:hypothetical protein